MDSCLAVEREGEKVAKRMRVTSSETNELLENVVDELKVLKDELMQLSPDSELLPAKVESVKKCTDSLSSCLKSVSVKHKDIHPLIAKLSRTIDKHFRPDFAVTATEQLTGQKEALLNNSICDHLFRQGRLDIAKMLMAEADLKIPAEHIAKFADMHLVLEALKVREVGPAMQWAQDNTKTLISNKSQLLFKLHRLKYISLLNKEGSVKEALAYAQNFQPFIGEHTKEIQQLMGCLAFAHRGLQNSPYKDLLDQWLWTDVAENFTKDACMMMGLGLESPLSISLSAGCMALPVLLQIHNVMEQQQVHDIIDHKGELPVEINLGQEYRFHSIFACPILRQQTSKQNPPIRLTCGHSISQEAVRKLAANSKRLKCPYCPMETAEKDIQIIHF